MYVCLNHLFLVIMIFHFFTIIITCCLSDFKCDLVHECLGSIDRSFMKMFNKYFWDT